MSLPITFSLKFKFIFILFAIILAAHGELESKLLTFETNVNDLITSLEAESSLSTQLQTILDYTKDVFQPEFTTFNGDAFPPSGNFKIIILFFFA